MFRKPFKIKTQVQIKSNEKKKILTDVKTYFPAINVDALTTYLGDKDDIVKMKVITYNMEVIEVWLIARVPMFFRVADQDLTLPTVYMCWEFPHIVPRVTTNDYVMGKLKAGADLFSPGVYTDTKDMKGYALTIEDAISVNTIANAAPSAVGITTIEAHCGLSSGRFARILHTVDDYLCRYHMMPQPSWGPVEMVPDEDEIGLSHGWPNVSIHAESSASKNYAAAVAGMDAAVSSKEPTNDAKEPPASTEILPTAAEDDLIMNSFLKGLKTTSKKSFPILPARFFANYMLPNVPSDSKLNMRKSKWKKLHFFLLEMSKAGIIRIETMRPNEYCILGANLNHTLLTGFVDPDCAAKEPDPAPQLSSILSKLKINIPPIVFDVGVRASNKKVTIISNLQEYGIDVQSFAKSLQQVAAASCLVTEPPKKGNKGPQVQVQGNQILVASKLINDSYGIGTAHMRGLEKAPKTRR